jgi:hypothetical protein
MRHRWILFVPVACACGFDYDALQGKATNGDGAAVDVGATADAADAAGSDAADVPIGLDTARDSSVALDLGRVEGGGAGGTAGTGGAGIGGAVGTGGGQAGSGGATGSDGLVGSGGAQTGGASGTGGVIGTGGLAGTGGVATGGTVSTGGSATGGTRATGGAGGTGGASDGGSGGCMTLFTSATDFATATSAMTSVVEDFTRDASDALVAESYFAVTYGDHYYQSSTLTFQSFGVQPDHNPGALDRTIVGAYGSIMSVATSIVARDGLVGSFSTPQNAVGLVWNDDKGAVARKPCPVAVLPSMPIRRRAALMAASLIGRALVRADGNT